MKKNADSLPVEKAQRIIGESVCPLETVEAVPLKAALLRVLAKELISPIDVPFENNAAMDGYAFCADGLDLAMPQTLKVVGAVFAGHRFEGLLSRGECVEIMTGGFVPPGCDTVIPLENVSAGNGVISFAASAIASGDNVRLRGEDVKAGEPCLAKGTLLKPAHLGLLASLGLAEVEVVSRPKVAVFSTGDELCPAGGPLAPGGIYDSNHYALYGMVKRLGCDVIDLGIIPDDPGQIRTAFLKAAEEADVIITTGGVSVGAADYTKLVMSELAEMAFWNVNMRPGRPMAFGRMAAGGKKIPVFGLPGNPVAVMVSFYFFVRDALLYRMGTRPSPLPRLYVQTLSPLSKRRGRSEFQRGIVSANEHGEWMVRSTGAQGSAMLSSMTQANCIIVLPPDSDAVLPGEKVEVIPFDGLV